LGEEDETTGTAELNVKQLVLGTTVDFEAPKLSVLTAEELISPIFLLNAASSFLGDLAAGEIGS